MGRTTTYSYTTTPTYQVQLTGIKAPGASANSVTYSYASDKVANVVAAGGTWKYTYGATSTTVTDPFSKARTINYTGERLVKSLIADSKQTMFDHCEAGDANCPKDLVKTVTQPEGNEVTYAYDARGNVTSTTHIAKSGSGLANIVTSAVYPASCTSANQRICNKPTSTTDARGKVTNYDWNASNGGLNWVKAPADAGGVRPETRITYANRQAYYKNSAGSIVASGVNVALPTEVASCRTRAMCISAMICSEP